MRTPLLSLIAEVRHSPTRNEGRATQVSLMRAMISMQWRTTVETQGPTSFSLMSMIVVLSGRVLTRKGSQPKTETKMLKLEADAMEEWIVIVLEMCPNIRIMVF